MKTDESIEKIIDLVREKFPKGIDDTNLQNFKICCENILQQGHKLENFFSNSKVSSFFERNKHNLNDNIIIDYDGRSYVRMMKLFTQSKETKIFFKENPSEYKGSINDAINSDFHLRFYIPKNVIGSIGKKIEKLVIMFNGMNEMKGFHLYDLIGEYFADNNIAAVLIPTPLHLNRRIKGDYDSKNEREIVKPTHRAISHKNHILFFINFIKSYVELNKIVDLVQGNNKKEDIKEHFGFYDNYFAGKKTQISLFGYSLGGLKALAYFMKDFNPIAKEGGVPTVEEIEQWFEKENKLHCCISFCSGPNLIDIDSDELGIQQKDWEKLLMNLNHDVTENKDIYQKEYPWLEVEKLIDIFRFLYFDEKKRWIDEPTAAEGRELVKGIIKNYLAVSGGLDPIVSHRQIQEISPENSITKHNKITGKNEEVKQKMWLNQLIAAEGDHHPSMEKSEWHEVLSRVENTILNFINSCGVRHYKRSEIHVKLKLLINQSGISKKVINECKSEFTKEHFKLIIKGLRSKSAQDTFRKYYYRSKAFDPNFPEVIRSLYPENK